MNIKFYPVILICCIIFKGCTTNKNFARLISKDITSRVEEHYKKNDDVYPFFTNFILNPDSLLKLNPNFNKDTVSVIINIYDGGKECYIICNQTDTTVYCQGKIKPLITTWDVVNCESCPKKNLFNPKRREIIEKFDTIHLNKLITSYQSQDEEICGGIHSYIIRIIFTQKRYKLDYMHIPNYI